MAVIALPAFAQPVYVPCTGTIPQVLAAGFTTSSINDDVVVNTDMIEHRLPGVGNTIKAISYGERATPRTEVYVEDQAGNHLTFSPWMPNASKPDVVVADDDITHNLPGMNVSYKVIVAYKSNDDLYYDIWRIDDCGLPSLNATHLYTPSSPLNDAASSSILDDFHNDPHIDMWSDANNLNPITGLPRMWEFAIVWTEGTRPTGPSSWPPCWPVDTINGVPFYPSPMPPRAFKLRIAIGDANNTSTSATPSGPGGIIASAPFAYNEWYTPDVACLTDNSVSPAVQYAEIVCTNGGCFTPNGLYLIEYDKSQISTPGYTPPATLIDNSASYFSPRIEAMSQYYGSGTGAKYQIVTGQDNASYVPRGQVWGYNDLGSAWLSDMFVLPGDGDCKAPCVAAGINPTFSQDQGNQHYTAGFFPRTKHDTLAERIIDAKTGALDNRWWQVVCPTPGLYYPWDVARSIAVANCSNSGLNLITAWYDGANILYKETQNTMLYRQTLIGHAANTAAGALRCYPNPASDELHVAGANAGAEYLITDIAGKMLLHGAITAGEAVKIGGLAPGMYLLTVKRGADGKQTITFTRQ